jgi:hypothetical protein
MMIFALCYSCYQDFNYLVFQSFYFERQKQLNIFHDYCLAWKLKVNIDKTKIVCFTNGRLPQNLIYI